MESFCGDVGIAQWLREGEERRSKPRHAGKHADMHTHTYTHLHTLPSPTSYPFNETLTPRNIHLYSSMLKYINFGAISLNI